jgi:RND family efflux transporter MFP subunit
MKRYAIALLLFGCSRPAESRDEPTPVEVHCAHPTPRTMQRSLSLRGRVAPPPGSDVAVASQVSGRIARLDVHEGDRIAVGTTIATVDDAPSRDALSQADAAVTQARANSVNADLTLERTRELVKRGIAAKQELDDAIARADQAHAALTSTAAAADIARRTLGHVQVRSAFAGTVTRIFRGPGALVDGTAQTPIAELAATDAVELLADVNERDLASLSEGQPAQITLTNGQPLTGQVRAVGASLDPMTGLGLVRITLSLADAHPRIGEFGTAAVVVAKREVPLTVPLSAVRGALADGASLVVCKDDKASLRKVTFGDRDDAVVEITSGLEASESIAIDHVLGLDDDTPIAPAHE